MEEGPPSSARLGLAARAPAGERRQNGSHEATLALARKLTSGTPRAGAGLLPAAARALLRGCRRLPAQTDRRAAVSRPPPAHQKMRPRRRAPARVWASWAASRAAREMRGWPFGGRPKIDQLSINRPVAVIGAGTVKSAVIWRPPSRWPFAAGTVIRGEPRTSPALAPAGVWQHGERPARAAARRRIMSL